ncbi:MAG: hypothetical protein KDE04_03970 [Anaerolineales bacterium]|nr:hypothetical protein [Anaerolineales bacterium]
MTAVSNQINTGPADTRTPPRWLARRPNLVFWGIFVLLNLLLFLPSYYTYRFEVTFWPSFRGETGDNSLRWYLIKYAVIRNNADIFRLSLEWLWLISAWVFLPGLRRGWLRWLVTILYFLGFVYNIYDAIIFGIYNEYPNLYDDALLLISGIEGLTRHIGIPFYVYLIIPLAIGAFFLLCAWLIRQLLAAAHKEQLHWLSRAALLLLLLYSAAMVFRYAEFLDHPRIVASSIGAKLNRNLRQSYSTYQNQQLLLQAREHLPEAYDYSDFALQEKPDIYLIFVESYGDAIYQFDTLLADYLAETARLESELNGDGWQVSTIRSEAPIRGGKSWLSYTSVLFGLRVDDEAQYDVMLNSFADAHYPHLLQYLQTQGYDTQRITPLEMAEQDRPKWEQTGRFLGFDHWIFLNDMGEFNGRTYGWGPSPPDQYTISYMRDVTEADRPDTPHLYFYITHNSHLPWVEPPTVVDDWHTLADVPPQAPTGYDPYHETKEAYLQSIFYQLEMVTQIIRTGPPDALYVIVGDHQPPLRAFADYDGPATPMHIISQDEGLHGLLTEYGYANGFPLGEATIKHEGFYSLFMQLLLRRFGGYGVAELPPIRPDGVDLQQLVEP